MQADIGQSLQVRLRSRLDPDEFDEKWTEPIMDALAAERLTSNRDQEAESALLSAVDTDVRCIIDAYNADADKEQYVHGLADVQTDVAVQLGLLSDLDIGDEQLMKWAPLVRELHNLSNMDEVKQTWLEPLKKRIAIAQRATRIICKEDEASEQDAIDMDEDEEGKGERVVVARNAWKRRRK